MSELIIDSVYGWREDDYDGYNDYYVNPEYHRSETTRKRVEQQDEAASIAERNCLIL